MYSSVNLRLLTQVRGQNSFSPNSAWPRWKQNLPRRPASRPPKRTDHHTNTGCVNNISNNNNNNNNCRRIYPSTSPHANSTEGTRICRSSGHTLNWVSQFRLSSSCLFPQSLSPLLVIFLQPSLSPLLTHAWWRSEKTDRKFRVFALNFAFSHVVRQVEQTTLWNMFFFLTRCKVNHCRFVYHEDIWKTILWLFYEPFPGGL